MFLVDTNILVYAANTDAPEHERARHAVERWKQATERWLATWPILYEFLRVVTHRGLPARPLTMPEAWSFVRSLLNLPHFSVLVETDRHAAILQELIPEYPLVSGSVLHDFHTAVLMKEHGVTEIRSADTDFYRFHFLRVVNPLQEA